jgi:hypothetical protein
MRFVFLLLLLGLVNLAHSQEKVCSFPADSVMLIDSLTALPLIDSLKTQEFETLDGVEDIPEFIKQILACWQRGFEIANRYRYRQILMFELVLAPSQRHSRHLHSLWLSKNYLVMSYERGVCYATPHLVIFKLENKTIYNCWHGLGGFETMEQLFWGLKHCPKATDYPSYFRTSF